MRDQVRISDRVVVGNEPPTAEMVDRLARDGFKAVVNLRTANEPKQVLTPDQERAAVEGAGMAYRHIPVASTGLSPELVDSFREAVSRLPAPVFVHCASGRRAGSFSVMLAAAEEGLSGDSALKKASDLGFDWSNAPDLEAFVRRYVDRSR